LYRPDGWLAVTRSYTPTAEGGITLSQPQTASTWWLRSRGAALWTACTSPSCDLPRWWYRKIFQRLEVSI